MKANEMCYFSNLFDKVVMLASASVVRMTSLADTNRTSMTNTCCVYTVLRYC